MQLEWIAVHRTKAVFTSAAGLDYRNHLDAELGAAAVAYFDAELGALGLDPAEYFLMPVHPWQWDNKLTVTFAAEIAQQHIVHLGIGADSYQAQQSIRTFFNTAVAGEVLRQDGHVRAEHGLYAGAVAAVHEGHPGHQRLAPGPDPRRRRPAEARADA